MNFYIFKPSSQKFTLIFIIIRSAFRNTYDHVLDDIISAIIELTINVMKCSFLSVRLNRSILSLHCLAQIIVM